MSNQLGSGSHELLLVGQATREADLIPAAVLHETDIR